MELKKITYSGIDTDDVTKQMEEGNDKLAEKGWREYRVDMLSSSTVRVTYARGEEDEEGEEALCPSKRCDPVGGAPPTPEKGMTMAIGLIVGIVFCAAVLFFQHKNKDDDDDEK